MKTTSIPTLNDEKRQGLSCVIFEYLQIWNWNDEDLTKKLNSVWLMTFVKIANSAFLLRHLLISMEVLTKKWTPAEFGTKEFLKKRKMINRHFVKIFSTSLSSDSIERNSVL